MNINTLTFSVIMNLFGFQHERISYYRILAQINPEIFL